MPTTWWPSTSRRSTRCEPMNPAAPVTTTFTRTPLVPVPAACGRSPRLRRSRRSDPPAPRRAQSCRRANGQRPGADRPSSPAVPRPWRRAHRPADPARLLAGRVGRSRPLGPIGPGRPLRAPPGRVRPLGEPGRSRDQRSGAARTGGGRPPAGRGGLARPAGGGIEAATGRPPLRSPRPGLRQRCNPAHRRPPARARPGPQHSRDRPRPRARRRAAPDPHGGRPAPAPRAAPTT